MAWPGLGECTAYPKPGQDSPPLGVRWLSEGLGGAGGRGWEERAPNLSATGKAAENRKRESARPTAGDQAEEAAGGCRDTDGEQRVA